MVSDREDSSDILDDVLPSTCGQCQIVFDVAVTGGAAAAAHSTLCFSEDVSMLIPHRSRQLAALLQCCYHRMLVAAE